MDTAVTDATVPHQSLTFYPFAYALLDDELNNYCWYCLKENEEGRMSRCSGCHVALFCNKSCQQLGWIDHKAECRGMACTPDSLPPPGVEVRMLGRLVLRYKQIVKGQDRNTAGFYVNRSSRRKLMDLCHHADDIRKDPYAAGKFDAVYHKLISFYDRKFLMDKETVFQIHCRNYINRHAISDRSYLKEIAKGLYLDLCAYNHSCRPNCFYLCKGIVAELRALDAGVDLTNTETTCYTYIDLLNSKQERRKLLYDTWYFKCECSRCLDQSEHVLTGLLCERCRGSVAIFEDDDSLKDSARCSRCNTECSKERIAQSIALMKAIEDILDSALFQTFSQSEALFSLKQLKDSAMQLLSPVNISYIHLLQAEIHRTDPSNVHQLLIDHLAATDCMQICYPANHPSLAYHLMNIGLFYVHLNEKEKGRKYLTEAYDKLRFALSTDHSMTQQCSDWLQLIGEP